MNNDEKNNKPRFDWLKAARAFAILIGIFGTAIGGMLHFLNEGNGDPHYQYFVLRLSAFVIIVVFFFILLAAMGLLASESGKMERDYGESKYARFTIRFVTGVFMIALGLSAYAMMITGADFFGEALREYAQSIKAQMVP